MLSDTKKLIVFGVLLVAGCTFHAQVGVQGGGGENVQPGLTGVDQPESPPVEGQVCQSSEECPRGQSCQGDQGCGAPWTCQPNRICTQDLVPYCGCDGQTFRASSSCPNRPYVDRGACEAQAQGPDAPPPPPSVAQQPTTGPDAPPPPPSVGNPAQNVACTSSEGCQRGQMCLGGEGCGEPWTCQPSRPCTRDLVPFCGCDGQTFRGSSTCPARPYAHRGACAAADQNRPADSPPPPISRRGQRCNSRDDCGEGLTCTGGQGCNAVWTCQPSRPCTMDLAPFCGCDGQNFRGSSSCPARPYSHRGACP